uniref:Uncharacterized protein n=1 Tax=Plectus sambesii TaxID=2011161 RepID=A0A914W612_9BILA
MRRIAWMKRLFRRRLLPLAETAEDHERRIRYGTSSFTKRVDQGALFALINQKGAYPTTLMNHLASKHRKQHQEVSNKKAKDDGDRDQKERKKNAKQQRINFPVQAALKYAKDSSHKRMIDEHLALFAGCTSFAYHLVECTEFKEFVLALNPRYELPCRETLKKFVARVAREIKENIKELMKNSGKVAICVDIWTQRNMVASYLAITAHFYCFKTGKLENVCLAVKQMTKTHSAGAVKAITDEILAEFDLSDDRTSRFRADNGSNIVAAFRESLIEVSAKLIDNDFIG